MRLRFLRFAALVAACGALSPEIRGITTLAARPLLKNVASGAAIYSIGDVTAQRLTSASSLAQLDARRLRGATILGVFWYVLALPNVYLRVEARWPGAALPAVLKKTAVSCVIFSLVGNWVTMFLRRAYATHPARAAAKKNGQTPDGASLADVRDSCNHDILRVIRNDVKIWPAYDILCFSLIPPALRPAVTATVSCGWSTYLSIVSARTIEPVADADDAPPPETAPASGVARAAIAAKPSQ